MNIPELAFSSGVDKSVISRIENGHITPSLQTMQKLAAGLKMGVDIFLANSRFDEGTGSSTRVNTSKKRLLTCADCLRKRFTSEADPVCGRCGSANWLDEFPEPFLMQMGPVESASSRASDPSALLYFLVSTDDLAPHIVRGDLLVVDPNVWVESPDDVVVAASMQTGEFELYRYVRHETGVEGAFVTELRHLRPTGVYPDRVKKRFDKPFFSQEDQPEALGKVIELRRSKIGEWVSYPK